MRPETFLIVETGEPYHRGESIGLEKEEILLGRAWGDSQPDLAFTNLYVSRRHALIFFRNNQFYIMDLGSKHGTALNNRNIEPGEASLLNSGDHITLAKGAVSLRFDNPSARSEGDTVDFMFSSPDPTTLSVNGMVICPERREVLMNGQPVPLSGKEVSLILFLYERRNKAVSYDEIKVRVWPERIIDPVDNVPDVGNDEITALVYRLRKKLGKSGKNIVAVPRFGYMFEFLS